MDILVSVIVPVFNSENFLNQCLKSVINQTYKKIEIIVVDDGSTDDSKTIYENLKKQDSRIKTVKKKNSGVSSARNLGISMAKGDFYLFLDADDFLDLRTVEILVATVKKNHADIVIFSYSKVIDNNTIDTKESRYLKKYDSFEAINDILDDNYYSGYVWNKMFKATILNEPKYIRFNENIHMNEDLLFCIEAFLQAENIVYDNIKLYNYVIHENSAMSTFSLKTLTSLTAYEDILDLIIDHEKINITDFKKNYIKMLISLRLRNIKINGNDDTDKLLKKKLEKFNIVEIEDKLIQLTYYFVQLAPNLLNFLLKIRRNLKMKKR